MEEQSLFFDCVPILIGLAYLTVIVGQIVMIVRAFMEDPWQGVAVLFLPLYWLYYGISRLKTRAMFPMVLMSLGIKVGLDTIVLSVYLPKLSDALGAL